MRAWFSGRMTAFQAVDGSSILPARTETVDKAVDTVYKGQSDMYYRYVS